MYGAILGFQKRVWCPKWTPASSISRIVIVMSFQRLVLESGSNRGAGIVVRPVQRHLENSRFADEAASTPDCRGLPGEGRSVRAARPLEAKRWILASRCQTTSPKHA